MIPKISKILMCSLVLTTNLYSPLTASASSYNNVTNVHDDETNTVNLLPEKYRALVTQNLVIAGNNKAQLLQAIQKINQNYLEGLGHLLAYMPKNDLQNLSADFILENVNLAYQVKEQNPWPKNNVPTDIFLNDVLPYVNVTETRDNWRQDFYNKFYSIAVAESSVFNAVKKLNQYVFDTYNVRYHPTLREKPDQSPYESIKIGYASCSGLSILIADVLRAVGIPARLAGIPVWPTAGGNHTWVEVWDNGWHYIGAAEPGEYDSTWFTQQAKAADPNSFMNSIYAVSYEKTSIYFPMVWDFSNHEVYAENVTQRYK